jgi:hypothetical protein
LLCAHPKLPFVPERRILQRNARICEPLAPFDTSLCWRHAPSSAINDPAFNREESRKDEEDATAALRSAGIEFIELTPEQKDEFRTITQGPMIEWLKTKIKVPSLIDRLLSEARAAK